MAFDSAVPVEGVEEKSTVVKNVDKDTRQQEDVKDNLGNLAKTLPLTGKRRQMLSRANYLKIINKFKNNKGRISGLL